MTLVDHLIKSVQAAAKVTESYLRDLKPLNQVLRFRLEAAAQKDVLGWLPRETMHLLRGSSLARTST